MKWICDDPNNTDWFYDNYRQFRKLYIDPNGGYLKQHCINENWNQFYYWDPDMELNSQIILVSQNHQGDSQNYSLWYNEFIDRFIFQQVSDNAVKRNALNWIIGYSTSESINMGTYRINFSGEYAKFEPRDNETPGIFPIHLMVPYPEKKYTLINYDGRIWKYNPDTQIYQLP